MDIFEIALIVFIVAIVVILIVMAIEIWGDDDWKKGGFA
jgi:hypothetical protein